MDWSRYSGSSSDSGPSSLAAVAGAGAPIAAAMYPAGGRVHADEPPATIPAATCAALGAAADIACATDSASPPAAAAASSRRCCADRCRHCSSLPATASAFGGDGGLDCPARIGCGDSLLSLLAASAGSLRNATIEHPKLASVESFPAVESPATAAAPGC